MRTSWQVFNKLIKVLEILGMKIIYILVIVEHLNKYGKHLKQIMDIQRNL